MFSIVCKTLVRRQLFDNFKAWKETLQAVFFYVKRFYAKGLCKPSAHPYFAKASYGLKICALRSFSVVGQHKQFRLIPLSGYKQGRG